MKRLLLLAALSFFVAISAAQAGAENKGGPGPQAQPVQLRSVQADFIQEKHLKILARPIVSTGSFTFQAPQSLRWEYRTPIRSILLMHGGKVRKFVEREGVLAEDKGMRLDAMQVVLAEISNWLDGRFTDNAMFTVSFPKKQTILLTPKEQGLAALISSIELKLGDQAGLLDKVIIFEGPDAFTSLTFSNRIINKEIPAAVFTNK
ncbi:MAG: outer membrane lipoprotein carrier protein LolA [Desulfobulbia bacterium]